MTRFAQTHDGLAASPHETPNRYRSALDTWLVVLIVISTAFPALMIALDASRMSGREQLVAALALSSGVLIPALLFAVTSYELSESELVVRVGPFRTRVPYAEITTVTPSSDMTSAPAWSLDRLDIAYGRGKHVLISPTPREAFLQALGERRTRTGASRRTS